MTSKKHQPPEPDDAPEPGIPEPDPVTDRVPEDAEITEGVRTYSPSFPIVGIGASAGGLEAASRILRELPPEPNMAFVIVQHLDPTHPTLLPEILGRETGMPVAQAKDETPVEPNNVYVIPPGVNMAIANGALKLSPRTEARGMHRPIDFFLRSLAEDQGHAGIAVILSGSATDGTMGCEAVKREGGITFAQDETAQYESMPQSAIAAGCVDFVLPPERIARELMRIRQHPYARAGEEVDVARERNLRRVIDMLQNATGVDFGQYKTATLYRRIARRMVLHRIDALKDYIPLLQADPGEIEALYQDFLISVTSFFRNPEGFEMLRSKVFPQLTEDRSRLDPVRIWVLGCSTGEEAYSLAMSFIEFAEGTGRQYQIQIFATDLNGQGIEKARVGIYPRDIVQDVSPDRLRRFFTEVDGSYRISKQIRDICVFAQHNALAHAPFSRIDLVSCRNLMIYLQAPAQRRLISVLHYALKPDGVLWLGQSEALGSYRDLFQMEDPKYKLYRKAAGSGHLGAHMAITDFASHNATTGRPHRPAESDMHVADIMKDADRVLIARFSPPGVLVDSNLDVLQFRGDTGAYLAPMAGKPSHNLLKMLRPGLLVGVRAAYERTLKDDKPASEDNLRVRAEGGVRDVSVDVVPVKGTAERGRCFLVLFREPHAQPPLPASRPAEPEATGDPEDVARQVVKLTAELDATREYLQSVIEQQEAANEELQSANEEVLSANEELQSINEELETSKEEIQSSNEELATVNDELNNRNLELGQSNDDMSNLLASVQMAIVMLGQDLRIRRFTPMAEKMLNLISADVGRPMSDIKLNIDVPDLDTLLLEVVDTVTVIEREVRDRHGRWHLLRIRPYKTLDNRIGGAVLILVEIDAIKRNQEMLLRQTELLEQTHEPILIREAGGKILYWNHGAEQLYGYHREHVLGKNVHDLLGTEHAMGLAHFQVALERDGQWTGVLVHRTMDGRRLTVESRQVLVRNPDGSPLVLETNRDVTDRNRLEEDLRRRLEQLAEADRYKNEFLAMLAHELRNPLTPLRNALLISKESFAEGQGDLFQRAWSIMDRQTQNLTHLVDDLLDVARITQGQIQLRLDTVEVEPIVSRAVDVIRPHVESREQHLTVSLPSVPVRLQADGVRLEQVVVNLLSNASKFAKSGGNIRLEAEVAREGPSLVLRVRDDGVGIPADLLPSIFEPFVQIDRSLGRHQGGLGIGLTIVKRVIELHGGTVEARSEGSDRGSEFIIRLPLQEGAGDGEPRSSDSAEADRTGASEEPAPVGGRGRSTGHSGTGTQAQGPRGPEARAPNADPFLRRILVVDDNPDAAESLAILLRRDGHQVLTAWTGEEALRLVDSLLPEIVLLDIGLPGMDGFEVAQHLLSRGLPAPPTLVALTGYGQRRERVRAAQVGFSFYLTKPVELNALREILEQNLTAR